MTGHTTDGTTGTTSSPERLEAEIAAQREALAETVDALTAKLDVKARAQAKAADLKDQATDDRGRPTPPVAAAGIGLIAGVAVLTYLWWKRR